MTLLYSLRHDFPSEWAAFTGGAADFEAPIRRDHFPYFTRGRSLVITGIELYGPDGANAPRHHAVGTQVTWDAATESLNDASTDGFRVVAPEDAAGPAQILVRAAATQAF